MKPLAQEDLAPLLSLIGQDRGIDLSIYKDAYLRRRLGKRLRASSAGSLQAYLRLLARNGEEVGRFMDTLTVNTSQFFRNPSCFALIGRVILPSLLPLVRERRPHSPFAWSIGCAKGEEAFSLAMLAAGIPGLHGGSAPCILATDIDSAVLDVARAGIYRASALRDVPPELAARFLRPGDGVFQVTPEIRGMVRFAGHDISRDPLLESFPLVLCRNLLIYLQRQAQEAIMDRLADCVTPGGYLVLGKSEILLGRARESFVPLHPTERIYQRAAGGLRSRRNNEHSRRIA
jgi:chemotaxis protein methyltransferase CheR